MTKKIMLGFNREFLERTEELQSHHVYEPLHKHNQSNKTNVDLNDCFTNQHTCNLTNNLF